MTRVIRALSRFAATPWYPLLVAALAAADAYIFFVPIEVLLTPAVLAHRRRWALTAFWITLGSAIGAASFSWLTTRYGRPFLDSAFSGVTSGKAWEDSERYIQRHGGLGLALISLSPFPQHPAVAVAGLARMNALVVFAAVFAGRFVKYVAIAWALVKAPKLARRLGLGQGEPKS
jgi:membrane protein YqaA with SNARE-associated domain